MKDCIDLTYQPIEVALREYEAEAKDGQPFAFSVIRSERERYTVRTKIIRPLSEETIKYVERQIKGILYIVGGYKLQLAGDSGLIATLCKTFSAEGERAFDVEFMSRVYGKPFETQQVSLSDIKETANTLLHVGGNTTGCRIGFDAGGSDRKAAAVMDGKVVYSEEVVWFPKLNDNPQYHKKEIIAALKNAASKLPHVDAIGVSTAGIVVNNEIKVASLFIKVPEKDYSTVRSIYTDCAAELGNVPVTVANDGDVTALAGAAALGEGGVLGIAMGTSQATGYYTVDKGLNGWLNELAFVPIDYSVKAMTDEWSGDYGCGVKYFSQDGVIKLAEQVGIILTGSPAEKLKQVQTLANDNNPDALRIYDTIGFYLGHTIPYYCRYYEIKYLLLLGRVMSGKGGERIIAKANEVLKQYYAAESAGIKLTTPDEAMRRVGQAVTAASL